MKSSLILVLSVLSISLLITGCFANNGQCTYARSRRSSSIVYRQAYNTVRDSTTYGCKFLRLWRCTRYSTRYVYYRASSVHYYTSYYSVTECCSGYAAINGQCRPHCSQGCSHGSCTSPGVCSCSPGWTGSSCSNDIVECSSNNGGCAQHCSNSEGSYSCYCSSGYNLATDGHSCVDINECNTNNGGCSHSCSNNQGSYTCSCPNGYHVGNDDRTCVDTNECLNNNGGCSDNCNNSPGSYSCSCNSNYYLTTDKHTCLDINECTNGAVGIGINNGTNWCEQSCVNTPGSYSCDCNPGYTLNTDNKTCSDINECLDNNGGCSQTCTNTPGSHTCSCQIGYILLEDKTSCTDHCECCTSADDCQQVCHNTAGSYYCTCWSGYRVSATNSSACEDINECSEGSSGCDQVCMNEIGGYNCSCLDGYTVLPDGHSCEDINECHNSNGGCEHSCINTPGSYYCECLSGYYISTNNRSCLDINECTTKTSNCSQVCVNNVGSYSCSCYEGYIINSDGATCDDVNECSNGNGGCQHTCVNTVGSFTCQCNPGYRIHTNGYSCVDIDECTSNTSNCSQVCINSIGGFSCDCFIGYNLNPNKASCDDINECLNDNGGCQQICINTVGSYDCQCHQGYSKNASSCIALDCPVIAAPMDGHMTCSGEQVTDQNCTFWCDPGYNITGSSFRTCLGSNQSWSGKKTSCSKSQCPALASTKTTFIAYPCSNEYLDYCQLYCETGYINDDIEIIWSQTCNVTGAQSEAVDWYPNQACKGRNICKPNPCMPGTCSVEEDDQSIKCDCSGTYYTGERCQLGYAVAHPVPALVKGNSEDVTITSKPLIQTMVSIAPSDNSSLGINKQMISLNPQSSSGSYTVQANRSGLFTVSYDVIPGSLYLKPDDTLILVTERTHGQVPDYFTSQGLQSGHLGVGCCSKQLTLSREQCFSNLTLHSYCQWNQMESSTDGVVHLSIGSLYLPVSIAGVKVTDSLPLSLDTHYSTDQCQTCDKAPNQHCHKPSLIMDYNSNSIQTILQHKSLSISLFSSIKNFLPSWLKMEVHPSISSSYSAYDFTTFIGSAKEVKRLPGCDKIELADTSALLYAHRTTSILLVTIDSHPAFYHSQPISPICIIIDACSGLTPTLKLAIPPSLVSKNNAASIRALNLLIAGNAQVNFQSISLQEDGIMAPELQRPLVYWNGHHRFNPTLPTYYQYKLNINFQRTFFTGKNLKTDVKFKGSVYYQPNATIKEIPGLLVGKISLNVTTIINQRSVNLMLTSDEYPAIFTYPTEGASYENLPVGLSLIMKYNKELTDSFYHDHFSIPQSMADCQILAFLSFDESLNINNVSLTTDCFTLRIGSLHFQQGLRHNILLPDSTTEDPLVSLILTSYRLSGSPYKFGRFSFLNPHNGPVLKVMHSSSINKMIGTLYSVNISLLNSHSLSNMSIANNQMTFQAQAKVFMNYDTRIIGSLTTNNSANIELDGEFIGTFRSDISSYISQHLRNELNDVIKTSNRAIDSVRISEKWRDELYLQLTDNNNNLSQEEKRLKQDNKSLIKLKTDTNDALDNLTIALESYIVNNDTLSLNELLCNNIDVCNNECHLRLSCQPYNNNITFSVPGSCNEYELASRIVKQVKVVLIEEWQEQIQCQSCWKTKWHKFLYFSQTQCCNKIKVRVLDMNQYKLQYVNSAVNESTLRSCIAINNTQSYDTLNCREEVSCYHEVTNTSCFNVIAGCFQELGEYFATANSTISQLYSTYLNALLKEEEMKLIIARKDAKIYRLRENTELLESLFHTANQSYHTNVKANESLFEETDSLIPFVSSFDTQPVREIDILEVTNISFQFSLTNYTPAILPIEISYSMLDTGEEHSFIEMVNFLQPRELILRHLSASILKSYVFLVRGAKRHKRDNHEAMASSFSSSIKFHDTCLQIKGSNLYIKQILELLGQSFAEFNSTVSVINATAYINESQDGIPPIIVAQYNLIKADVSKQSHSLIQLLKNNSFASWQAQIEAIHSSITPLELFGCSSYLDCIGGVANELEDILEDTSGAVQELSQLRQIKDIILQVACNKSLSYSRAHDALKQLLTVTESNVVIEQWCTEPPIITTHPPSSVSIEINSSIELSCTASSSLTYYWVKDNITIPGSNSNKLMLNNVKLEDEGEYRCVAVNDAGSSASIPSLVNIIMKPILNLTLPSRAYVHEDDTRGFQLTCDAYGIPAPGWMWFYKESEAHNWTLISNSSSNVLTFKDIGFDDEGWYQCVAFNPAGGVTSTPVFLNVLSMVTPTIQYTFVLMLSGARKEWVQPIIDLLVSETNISALVTGGSLTVFSGNITSVSFTIQTDNTTLFDEMSNVNNELDELATQMMYSVSQLEQDKDALLLLLQRNNQLAFSLEDSAQSVSLIDYTIGPRTFTCSKEYQLDSGHLKCVACRPGSYGQVYMRSFVESETIGEYIEELVPQCLECPVGTYQENEGQSNCVSCPANYGTSRTGSASVSDCKELCTPHHFSPTGLHPCSPCPPLTYQQYIGQRKCFPCGNDTMFDACTIPASTTSIIKVSNTDNSITNIGSSKLSSHYTTEHPPHSTVIKNSTSFSKSPVPSAVGVEGESNQFSTGAIIGIIAALVIVVVLIIILIIAIVITRRNRKMLQEQDTSANQQSYEVELNNYERSGTKDLEVESDDLKLKKDEAIASLPIDDLHIYDELPPPLEEITEETIKGSLPPPLPPANNPYSSINDNDDDIMEKKSLKVADLYSSSDEEY